MKHFIIYLSILFLPSLSLGGDVTKLAASAVFALSEKKEFVPFPTSDIPRAFSGPMVPLGDGSEVHCSVLQHQAQVIADGGIESFDVAFKNLDHSDLYIRWIAVESLGRITGKRPLWYFYAKPGETWNSDTDWADRAKTTWKEWKAEQAGAGQPATRPELKSEGSDKPQPEAEGRSR